MFAFCFNEASPSSKLLYDFAKPLFKVVDVLYSNYQSDGVSFEATRNLPDFLFITIQRHGRGARRIYKSLLATN